MTTIFHSLIHTLNSFSKPVSPMDLSSSDKLSTWFLSLSAGTSVLPDSTPSSIASCKKMYCAYRCKTTSDCTCNKSCDCLICLFLGDLLNLPITIIYLSLHNVAPVFPQFHHSTKWINNMFFTSSLQFSVYYYKCSCPANSSTVTKC